MKTMSIESLVPASAVLGDGLVLLAWWYLPVIVVCFGLWAWIVSAIFDKDAEQFYLPRERLNAVHVSFGLAALAVLLVAPAPGFVTVPLMVAILFGDLIFYFIYRNKDERVPESMSWSLNVKEMISQGERAKGAATKATSKIVLSGPGGELPAPERHTPEYDIRVAAEELIHRMLDLRGYQLDIAPSRDGNYAASVLIDGIRQGLESMSVQDAVSIMDVYKTVAGLDLSDRRRKQVGQFKMGAAGSTTRTVVRCSTIGGSKSVRLSLLVDPEGQVQRAIDELGLLPNQLEDARAMADEQRGVVLLVAPPDHGRTSTLYAFIRHVDAYLNNVQTVEVDQQAEIEGVRHNIYDPAEEAAEFSATVRSIIRRDPNICGVAEFPDDETARVIAKAENDRVRTYLSFNCDNALAALQVYVKAVGDQKLAAQSLHGVVAQRLVRHLCQRCRVQFQPNAEMLKKIGLPPDTKQLYRKSGQILVKDKPRTCDMCDGSGYFGQVGVFEVYPLGPEERELIAVNDLSNLRARFRRAKRQSIQTAALQHAINGETSIEEVVRMASPSKSSRAQKSAPSARAAQASSA